MTTAAAGHLSNTHTPLVTRDITYAVTVDPETETLVREKAVSATAPRPIGIVVASDSHLSPAAPRLTPQRRAERRERLRRAFSLAVSYAIEHDAKLFLTAGDLFDTPTPSNQDRAFVAAELARLRRAQIVCAGISGNHDTPRMLTEHGGEAPQQVYAALDGLRYFPASQPLTPVLLTLGDFRLALAGLSTNPVAAPGSDPLAGIQVEDPEGLFAQAHIGLLLLHAGIEGMARPTASERIVAQASLSALPEAFRAVVTGHIHGYARQRIGKREVIVCGATERMEFGTAPGGSGFVWLELAAAGLVRAEHITIEEQPRADLLVETTRLFPMGGAAPADEPSADAQASVVFETLRHALVEVCTDETMVRLRLDGPITRDQYHQLALREVLRYGQQHAFSFELDTSGLTLSEPQPTQESLDTVSSVGPLSPASEVERLAQVYLARLPADDAAGRADVYAAADVLLARLRASTDREAER